MIKIVINLYYMMVFYIYYMILIYSMMLYYIFGIISYAIYFDLLIILISVMRSAYPSPLDLVPLCHKLELT